MHSIWILLIVSFLMLSNVSMGQDFTFDQFYANRMRFNPAYAGSEYYNHVSAVTQYQYPGLGNPYITYGVSFDTYRESIRSGFGLMITRDDQGGGYLSRNYAEFAYSYQFKVSHAVVIRPALQLGVGYYQVDPRGLHFPDMYDNMGGIANSNDYVAQTSMLYDFAAGAIMSYHRFFAGVAVHHMLEPVEFNTAVGGFVLPRRITIHAGSEIPIESGSRFRYRKKYGHTRIGRVSAYPTAVIEIQDGQTRAQLGGLLAMESAYVGGYIRKTFPNGDFRTTFIFGIYSDSYNFGYSFDLGSLNGKIFGFNSSIHEVTLTLKMEYKKQKRKFWWQRKAIFGPEF